VNLPEKINGTVAWCIEQYMRDMPGLNCPIGASKKCSLKVIQSDPIGALKANALVKTDIIDWIKRVLKRPGRNGSTAVAATALQYFSHLYGVLEYVAATTPDSDNISPAALIAAKPFLEKHRLIGKGARRHQRPTEAQRMAILKLAYERNQRGKASIDLVKIDRWQYSSGMRVGATCKIQWLDWNINDQTMLIRGMKDPRVKNKQKVVALRVDAQGMLFELAHEINEAGPLAWSDLEPRIFPYKAKSVSQAHSELRAKAGFKGVLRLHDWRREFSAQLVEVYGYSKEEAICFTGHDGTQVYESTYMVLNPARMKDGPAARRLP
jgi:integrase